MSKSITHPSPPCKKFKLNLDDARVLFDIHTFISGKRPGRRAEFLKTISSSAIVLAMAVFESYFEDISEWAFKYILGKKQLHRRLDKASEILADRLIQDKKNNETKTRLIRIIREGPEKDLRDLVLDAKIKQFHNPSVENIENLMLVTTGIAQISRHWSWRKCKPAEARKKLGKFLKARHSVAHGRITKWRQKTINLQFAKSCFELIDKIVECSDKKIVECLS